MINKKLHPVFSIYSLALTWVLYAAFLPLHRISDIMIAASLSGIVSITIKTFLCARKTPAVKFEKTGVAEADAVIKKGAAFISEFDSHIGYLQGTNIIGQVYDIKKTAVSIFAFIEKNPDSARQLNTFMEYYFPTVIKLLDSYIEFKSGSPQSSAVSEMEDINTSIDRIESVMDNIKIAFTKQLDVLYQHKSLDIKTDIEVLKTILERENLI